MSVSKSAVPLVLKKLGKGSRGEWYLAVQAVLFLLLVAGPFIFRWISAWEFKGSWFTSLSGSALFFAGIIIAATGVISLGKNLTPLPLPRENSALIVTGAYRYVRHPIYSGIIFMAFGWALWRHNWITVGLALLLSAFFDIKSRFEERLLQAKFPAYMEYRKRVRKLLPFIY